MSNYKKKENNVKSALISVRATEAQKELISKNAKRKDMSVSEFLIKRGTERSYVRSKKEEQKIQQLVRTEESLNRLRIELSRYYLSDGIENCFNKVEEEMNKLWDY